MSSRASFAALMVPLAFVICDSATIAKLRVAPSRSRLPVSAVDAAASEAVQDGLSDRGYSCMVGKDPVVMLCEPTLERPAHPRPWVLVEREGAGYLVTIETRRAPGGRRDPEVCATARGISEKLESSHRSGVQFVVRADDRCASDAPAR